VTIAGEITKPAFVVAELPDPIAAWVRATRLTFEPAIAHLPAEITLAGSSGVGPISVGQSVDSIREKLEAAIAGRLPFEARFTGVGSFPGTEIFFAAPESAPFVALHRAIVNSGIAFGPSAFAYSPHCSLKGATPLGPGQREALAALSVPAAPFTIRAVSVYEVESMRPSLLFSIGG
jgi:2'-5' RNA ligase